MTTYTEKNNDTLLTAGSVSDAESDTVFVNKVNGVVPTSWPTTVTISSEDVLVYRDGTVILDDKGNTTNHPADTATADLGTFTLTFIDSRGAESGQATCTVKLEGVAPPTDTTAPVLTSPAGAENGWNAWLGTVVTDELCDAFVVLTGSVTTPSAANIKAGKDHTGSPADYAQTVPSAPVGTINFGGAISGATGNQTFYAHYSAEDKANPANVATPVTSSSFTTPAQPSSGNADATVSNKTALNSLLDSWRDDWTGTAASLGIATSAERTIELTPGSYGSFSRGADTFPQKVHIVGQDKAGGVVFATVQYSGTNNLTMEYAKVIGPTTASGGLVVAKSSAQNIEFRHLHVQGSTTPLTKGLGYGIMADGHNGGYVNNVLVENCFIERVTKKCILFRHASNCTARGNITNESGSDDYHFNDLQTGLFENNWGSVYHLNSSGSHMDFLQGAKYPAGSPSGLGSTNVTVRGNFGYQNLFPNPGVKPFPQGIFISDASHDGCTVTNNIVVNGNPHGIKVQGGSINVTVSNNTVLFMNGVNNPNPPSTSVSVNGTILAAADNVVRASSALGTGSLAVQFSDYSTYWGGLPQGFGGTNPIGIGGDAADLYPKAGTVMHWDHANPIGAHSRLKEIFTTQGHPGAEGWPVATPWQANYNRRGLIS